MQPSVVHRLFWGLILVAIGIVFLLDQTGTITFDIGWFFSELWPVFLILFGLQGLLVQRSGGFLWNAAVILLGFFFLGRNLNWFDWHLGDMLRYIGPVILILFGIRLIFKNGETKPPGTHENHPSYGWNTFTPPPVKSHTPEPPETPLGPPPAPPLSEDPNASFTGTETAGGTGSQPVAEQTPPRAHDVKSQPPLFQPAFSSKGHKCKPGWKSHSRHQHWNHWGFDPHAAQHHRFIGDVHIGHDVWELKPMAISHFIGDTTIDLTKAQIPLGETKIYVSCFIGDVKVFVPNDLGVGIQVVSSSLIGDVRVLDHKRGGFFNQMSVETPAFPDTDRRIVLVVSAFIGDVRITKVG